MPTPVRLLKKAVAAHLLLAALIAASRADEPLFRFSNAGREAGLLPAAEGIMGHAAGWGDADGDGWADLYIGTFDTIAADTTRPNMFFRNREGKFELDEQPALRISTRASGALFVDLDNDGDLDLFVSSMPAGKESRLAGRFGRTINGCTLFRNDGQGMYTDVSGKSGACPPAFGGRSVTALDYNGDGLLDLLVGEDPIPGYNGSETKSSRLFRNLGGLKFADASREAGLPADVPGLGVAAGDLNNDGLPDIFLASTSGGNRLFLGGKDGNFRESPGSLETFAWPTAKGDDMVCGVVFGDVNADGLLDVVLGQHYSTPWREPVHNRLYLNRGIEEGAPRFEDVTDAAGLVPLPMKSPHVEIQDFDNDGLFDISFSMVMLAEDGTPHPVIFRGEGERDGIPRFRQTALSVNDFPTDAERAINRSGEFFEHMIRAKKVIYMAPGPSCDYNRDGRLDLFLPSWWTEFPSLLLKNETPGGHWLDVRVEGAEGVNRMGIGSRVIVYEAGRLGDSDAILGVREIAAGFGYASAQEAIAHFGLGQRTACDVEVILPHGKGRLERKAIEADQRITMKAR